MTGPIANFEPQPEQRVAPVLIRSWVHRDRPCAIYFGGFSFNGYTQIPADSPLLTISEAHEIVYRAQASRLVPNDVSLGYDGLLDLIDDVHGSLTYGPDQQGWIGFDTGHAGDDWDDEIVDAALTTAGGLEMLDEVRSMREHMRELGIDWPPGRMQAKYGLWVHHWTLPELAERTEALAHSVDIADNTLRQVRAILG